MWEVKVYIYHTVVCLPTVRALNLASTSTDFASLWSLRSLVSLYHPLYSLCDRCHIATCSSASVSLPSCFFSLLLFEGVCGASQIALSLITIHRGTKRWRGEGGVEVARVSKALSPWQCHCACVYVGTGDNGVWGAEGHNWRNSD